MGLTALREAIVVVLLAITALSARVVIAENVPPSPPVSDMLEYWDKAVYIATHGRLYENSWRMPGYPAALAAVFAMRGGPSIEAARWFNAVVGTLAVLLTYWLARRTASRLAAAMAALAIAVYPSFIIYTTFVATETVVTAPVLGALIATTFSSRRAAAISGVCAGLATLVRPAGVALLPAVVLAFASRRLPDDRARRSLPRPLLAVIFFSLTLAPWWLHNARLHGQFVPLDTTGGINLLIGMNPFASGKWYWSAVSRLHAEYLPNVDTTTPAGANQAGALARSYMRENPRAVLQLVPAKLAALFAIEGREHAYLYSTGYFGARQSHTVWLWGIAILFAFPLLVVSAAAGCAVRGGLDARVLVPCVLFLLTSVAMHLVSFGDPRFHLPLVPVLAVLATGVARWQAGVMIWRSLLAVTVVLLLTIAWREQLLNYWDALIRLTAPDGWNSDLQFDDLL